MVGIGCRISVAGEVEKGTRPEWAEVATSSTNSCGN